jgi:hypothetical protein
MSCHRLKQSGRVAATEIVAHKKLILTVRAQFAARILRKQN